MANPAAPEIPIDLDKPRRMRFDFNAIVAYEEATGESIMAGGLKISSARSIRALLWASLLHEEPDLTVEAVGRLLHMGNAMAVFAQVQGALRLAMPEAAAGGNETAVESRQVETALSTG